MSLRSPKYSYRSSNDSPGFSLVELLVVISILALVAVASVALVRPKPVGISLKGTALNIVAMMRRARSRAILGNYETTVAIDFKNLAYWSTLQTKRRQLPPGTTGELLTTSGEVFGEQTGRVRFFPDGSSTGGQLRLQLGRSKEVININWVTGASRLDSTHE